MKNTRSKIVVLLVVALGLSASSRADLKAKTKIGAAGHDMESTVYIKASRQRSETAVAPGFNMVNILQCDLKRNVQINDAQRTYFIMAMNDTSAAPPATTSAPTRKGGTVTISSKVTDTGERKPMFGHNARRLKVHTSMQGSPGACMKENVTTDSDGWYIDVPMGLDCAALKNAVSANRGGGCVDDYRFNSTGGGRLGYPVQVTTTIDTGQGTMSTTQDTEDLSTTSLDPSLFDIPAGYREVHSSQELMGMPNMGDLMRGRVNSGNVGAQIIEGEANGSATASQGTLRIGIAPVINQTNAVFSAEAIQGKLIELFSGMNSIAVEAIPLQNTQLPDLDREAREKQCSYIVVTSVSALKEPSSGRKLGGFLSRAAGVDAGTGKYESTIGYKLFKVGDATSHLTATANSREGVDIESSVGNAAERAVAGVMAEIRREKNK